MNLRVESPQFTRSPFRNTRIVEEGRHTGDMSKVKSPSDTTIYNLGLKRLKEQKGKTGSLLHKVSDFVENIRMETESEMVGRGDMDNHAKGKLRASDATQPETSSTGKDDAEHRAEDVVVQAEKFRANVSAPKGMLFTNELNMNLPQKVAMNYKNDDNFFHVTCHIEASLWEKIERGEFIELE